MLELRPSCENCNKPLPPASTEACICSYECTFCRNCVDTLLHNVCSNCGGGFVPRPVRPKREWRPGACLATRPASTTVKHRPIDAAGHDAFSDRIRSIAPEDR